MGDFRAGSGADQLRQLVREVLAEVLRPAAPPAVPLAARPAAEPARPAARPTVPASPPSSVPAADAATPSNGRAGAEASGHGTVPARPAGASAAEPGSWTVRISSDDELHAFVLRVLKLSDNPKLRRDLIGGRVRFSLAGQSAGQAAQAVQRIDKGAVTERTVLAAAKAGARLVLGPRAVLTPLAGDKARALGVPIEKER